MGKRIDENGKQYYVDNKIGEWYRIGNDNDLYLFTISINNRSSLVVFGYFRKKQNKIFGNKLNKNKYYNIPQIIKYICLKYYFLLPQNWKQKIDKNGNEYYIDKQTDKWYRINSISSLLFDKNKNNTIQLLPINTYEKLNIIQQVSKQQYIYTYISNIFLVFRLVQFYIY